MRLFIICVFLVAVSMPVSGQPNILLRGQVIDRGSGEPIPYANIGIPSQHVGTSTDSDGQFSLEVSQNYKKDTLQISALGYEAKRLEVSEFLASRTTIRLQPKVYRMDSITVTDDEPETKWIGKKVRPLLGSGAYGMTTSGSETGAAFAFKIDWEQSLPIKVLYARMFLKRHKRDSLTMRCRITDVDFKTGKPGNDLVHQNVIVSVPADKGWVTCNFTGRDVYLDRRSFFVVFEWLRDPDEHAVAPMFSTGLFFNSISFVQDHTLGKWKKEPAAQHLIYSLKVEY